MPALNDITKMQKENVSEQDIVQNLRERGYSPAEIKQGLEQAKIKSSVEERESNATESMMQYPGNEMPVQAQSVSYSQAPEYAGMTPSAMDMPQEGMPAQQQQPEAQFGQQDQIPQANGTEEYIYPTAQAYGEGYQDYTQLQQSTFNPETITEISEQVSEEKVSKLRDELKTFSKFQISADKKLGDLSERLEKIEKTIEKLQFEILGRIGSYVKDVESIRKEMELTQNTMSKAIVPIIEKYQEKRKKKAEKKAKPKETKTTAKHSGIG